MIRERNVPLRGGIIQRVQPVPRLGRVLCVAAVATIALLLVAADAAPGKTRPAGSSGGVPGKYKDVKPYTRKAGEYKRSRPARSSAGVPNRYNNVHPIDPQVAEWELLRPHPLDKLDTNGNPLVGAQGHGQQQGQQQQRQQQGQGQGQGQQRRPEPKRFVRSKVSSGSAGVPGAYAHLRPEPGQLPKSNRADIRKLREEQAIKASGGASHAAAGGAAAGGGAAPQRGQGGASGSGGKYGNVRPGGGGAQAPPRPKKAPKVLTADQLQPVAGNP